MSVAPFRNLQVPYTKRDWFEPGDRMDQRTFHRIYEQMPEDFKAELIGGIVYVPAALRADHGDVHANIIAWLMTYKCHTPGTRALDNATHKLGKDSEPQPDASLLIVGGQTTVTRTGYIRGAPELIVEVVSSSRAYDLHAKKDDYEKYGVREYLALLIRENRAVWLVRDAAARFTELPQPSDGIYRSPLFAGLWLDAKAVMAGETKQVLDVLNLGLATPEHAAFVKSLQPKA
jgi:Uma2 family endonuclease